jgi:hypothetical protein
MSVSPTENALIVALDFEGRLRCIIHPIVKSKLKFHAEQASTVLSAQRRRTRFSYFSTLPSPIS